MSSLLELLQEVDPTSPPAMAADLRAALAAISLELQRDASRNQLSLSQWWQWLDDEGYDRHSFLAALSLLGRVRIGEDQWGLLLEACTQHGEEPEGLGWLLAQLDELDPDCPRDFHALELLALSEESELHQIAGGTSKVHRVIVDVGVIGILYCGYQYKKGNNQEAKFLQEQLQYKAKQYDLWMQQLAKDGRIELRLAKENTKVAAADAVNDASEHPQQTLRRLEKVNKLVFQNEKNIADYSSADIDAKVAKLVAEHTLAFIGKAFEKQAFVDLKGSPEYQQRLARAVDQEIKSVRPGVSIDKQALTRKAADALENGNWFKTEKAKLLASDRYRKMLSAEQRRLGVAYHKTVTAEITIAKREAAAENSKFLEARVKYVGDKIIHKSNVIIREDIVQFVARGEAFARDADRAAKREASAVIEEL